MLPKRRVVKRELGLVAVDRHGKEVAIHRDDDLLAGVARVSEGKLGLQSVRAAIGLAARLEGKQVFTWNAVPEPVASRAYKKQNVLHIAAQNHRPGVDGTPDAGVKRGMD